jgi:hypothetical protein
MLRALPQNTKGLFFLTQYQKSNKMRTLKFCRYEQQHYANKIRWQSSPFEQQAFRILTTNLNLN